MSGRHGKKHQSKQEQHNVSLPAASKIEPSPTVTQQKPKEALQQTNTQQQKAIVPMKIIRKPDPFDIALWGLFLTAIIAVIYYFQLRSMQDSVELSRKSTQMDQRAWLRPTIPNYFPLNGQDIPVDVGITNIGKTVATHVNGKVVGTVLKKGATPRFNAFDVCYVNFNAGASWPSEVPPLVAHLKLLNCAPGAKAGEAIVPTPELARQINDTKEAFIIFYGQINYCDIFGARHRTTFCNGSGGALEPDNINKCIDYNGADTNDLSEPSCNSPAN